jgi:CcmD family protein
MFFQEATPDTSGYMIAGYAITFLILGVYVVSMFLRQRNYQQDMSMLQEMDRTAGEARAGSDPAGGGAPTSRKRQGKPGKRVEEKTGKA